MRDLITKSLFEQTSDYIRKLPTHLLDESAIAVIDWIVEYEKDNGVTPTIQRFKKEEEFYHYAGLESPIDPLHDLYSQEVERLNANHMQALLVRATEAYANGEDQTKLFEKLKKDVGFLVQSKVKRATSIVDDERNIIFEDDTSTYLPIGIPNVDKASGGLRLGDSAIMFAPQNTGKTTIFCFIALRAALGGQEVLLISREMTRDELKEKIDAILGGFNDDLFKKLSKEDHEELLSNLPKVEAGLQKIKDAGGNIEIPEEASYTPANVQEMIRTKFEDTGRGYDLVLVDGLYLMSPNGAIPGTFAGTDWRLLLQLSMQLTDMAKSKDRVELQTRLLVSTQARSGAEKGGALQDTDIGYAKGIAQNQNLIFSIREYQEEEPLTVTQKMLMVEVQKIRKGRRASAVEGTRLLIDFGNGTLHTGYVGWDKEIGKEPLMIRNGGRKHARTEVEQFARTDEQTI